MVEENETLWALPGALVITLALRLTKVSGELRHVRGRPGLESNQESESCFDGRLGPNNMDSVGVPRLRDV